MLASGTTTLMRGVLVLTALITSQPLAASAQAVAAPQGEAPVVVFNRTITVLRGTLFGVNPQLRARRAVRTVDELLHHGGPGVVSTRPEPQGALVMIDGVLAFMLTPDDADRLKGETYDAAVQSAASALREVIGATREARDRSRLLRGLAVAVLGTVLFLVVCLLVGRTRNWLVARLTAVLERKAAGLQVGGARLVQGTRLVEVSRWLVRTLSWVLILALSYEWATVVLEQFPYTRTWAEQLDGFLLSAAGDLLGGTLHAIPDLLIALVIFGIARMVIAALKPFFDGVAGSQTELSWLDRHTAEPTRRIFSALVWVFALVMAYPYLPGSGSEAFKGITVLVGVMVTLGGTNLFGQAASGLVLIYSRAMRVGEYVRIGDYEGTVTELATFTTKLRTGEGEEISLSNTVVIGCVTKNYSRAVSGGGFVADAVVTIGYDTPWRQVEALLIEGARRTAGVQADPAPRVFKTALTDFYVEYRLICYALPSEARTRAFMLDELHANILDVFNEYGVQITSPHYFSDPAHAKLVPKEAWFAPPASDPTRSKP